MTYVFLHILMGICYTCAGAIIFICISNRKLKNVRKKIEEEMESTQYCYCVVNWCSKNPVPEKLERRILTYDGADWDYLSIYSSPMYSKHGKRVNTNGKEILLWCEYPKLCFTGKEALDHRKNLKNDQKCQKI